MKLYEKFCESFSNYGSISNVILNWNPKRIHKMWGGGGSKILFNFNQSFRAWLIVAFSGENLKKNYDNDVLRVEPKLIMVQVRVWSLTWCFWIIIRFWFRLGFKDHFGLGSDSGYGSQVFNFLLFFQGGQTFQFHSKFESFWVIIWILIFDFLALYKNLCFFKRGNPFLKKNILTSTPPNGSGKVQ